MNKIDFSKFKALVFDFDGVIVESHEIKGNAFVELYKHHDKSVQDSVLKFHLQNGGMNRFEKLRYFEKNILTRDASENKITDLAEQFSANVKFQVIEAIEVSHAIKFIAKANKHCMCFVNSATPSDELSEIIEARGWSSLFIGIYGSPSSKTANLLQIMEEHNIHPNQILFFGDAKADLTAAVNSGVNFCGVITADGSELSKSSYKGNWVKSFELLYKRSS